MWVINIRYEFALEMFERWGYELVDEILWVKVNANRRLSKGHGFFLQHLKETCLVGIRGAPPEKTEFGVLSDVLEAMRGNQSQKPVEIYDMAEALVPGGNYLEVFARKHNLRNWWS